MTTATQAFEAIKTRLGTITSIPFIYQNEDAVLPDTPAAFGYVEFLTDRALIASFGGGRGSNLYRNPAELVIYIFVPRGEGLQSATDKAETVAAVFRSYRDNAISCFGASVLPGGDGAILTPPGLSSPANKYWWAAVSVDLHFDQVG